MVPEIHVKFLKFATNLAICVVVNQIVNLEMKL